MSESFNIGMAEMRILRNGEVGVIFALGSCVGVCLYDPLLKIGAIAHIVLPESPDLAYEQNKYKFADTCIPEMVKQMTSLGCSLKRTWAKIAGGAQMFNSNLGSAFGDIGRRNIEAVKSALGEYNIPIIGEDTGQKHGRTMYFYSGNGEVQVKSFSKGCLTL
ncbi:MAG TPA: chemotaxis protein CheD [Clostridiales bacterium]|nr:chemotaxis protein CheD [Clostridiales bacterium]